MIIQLNAGEPGNSNANYRITPVIIPEEQYPHIRFSDIRILDPGTKPAGLVEIKSCRYNADGTCDDAPVDAKYLNIDDIYLEAQEVSEVAQAVQALLSAIQILCQNKNLI